MERRNITVISLPQGIVSLSIILLSLTGIQMFEIGELQITPFYLFSPLLIITYLIIKPQRDEFGIVILQWTIVVITICTAISSYFRPSSFFHFLFYVGNGYILINIGKFCIERRDAFLSKINKLIIPVNTGACT